MAALAAVKGGPMRSSTREHSDGEFAAVTTEIFSVQSFTLELSQTP
jgi:hypothetical protein